jgi:ectoine hydroxylase-related dioxygenase (phytanoyl-CoA dioxygenase family)
MRSFTEVMGGQLDGDAIRSHVQELGYVMVRQLIPKPEIDALLLQITRRMQTAGWLAADLDSAERMAPSFSPEQKSNFAYGRLMEEICDMQAVHHFMHHPALEAVMKLIAGPRLLVHPKAAVRIIFPGWENLKIHAHQDFQDPHAMGGDSESFTAWMPLHGCPLDMGPLRILEKSHLYGLQKADPVTSYVVPDSMRGDAWAQGDMSAGDVLFFHSLTIHEALANRSPQVRISGMCRFQDYERAINPGSLVFTGKFQKSWAQVYACWDSPTLQFYWKSLPLQIRPSKEELALLAISGEPSSYRGVYARVLDILNEAHEMSGLPV